MKILEMNKQLEINFTSSFEKLISYYNKLNIDDNKSTSTDTSNNFIQETKREINTFFMNKKGNSKEKIKVSKNKNKKSRSPKHGRGPKSGKSIPKQVIESEYVQEGKYSELLKTYI